MSEGHVEAQWSTGVDEDVLASFCAWLLLSATQETLDFFAHEDLPTIGREVNDNFEKYTNSQRFLHGFDVQARLWQSLITFRGRSLPAIEV